MNLFRNYTIGVLLLLLLSSVDRAVAQSNWQWEGGLSISLGQPTNRLGFAFRGQYFFGPVGLSMEINNWLRLTGMGPNTPRWEGLFGLGPIVCFGEQAKEEDRSYTFSNRCQSSIQYLFLRYQEKQTAQFSGRLTLQHNQWMMVLENDALAGFGRDRFRTGTLELYYTKGADRVGLQMALWTGETRCAEARRAGSEAARNGLRLIDACPYGKISHGILKLNYNRRIYPGQQVGIGIGIDDERIRHIFQNRVMHDWILSLNRKVKNPHLPMLDENGMPIIDLSLQNIRRPRMVWSFDVNHWSIY